MRYLELKRPFSLPFPSRPTISLVFQPSTAQLSSLSSSSSPSSSSCEASSSNASLTQEELTKINLLLPRLCLSKHLPTAIRLISTALLTNPLPKSVSLSILVDSLASQPDMALSMSLLNRVKHSPGAHPYLTPINTLLIASYFRKHKPKEALVVFNWMVRPGSPSVLDEKVCGILISGFCRKGMVFEALKVLRAMLGTNLVPGRVLSRWIYRSLLREARIKEAVGLDEALSRVEDDGGDETLKRVVELVDHMIAVWTD